MFVYNKHIIPCNNFKDYFKKLVCIAVPASLELEPLRLPYGSYKSVQPRNQAKLEGTERS